MGISFGNRLPSISVSHPPLVTREPIEAFKATVKHPPQVPIEPKPPEGFPPIPKPPIRPLPVRPNLSGLTSRGADHINLGTLLTHINLRG